MTFSPTVAVLLVALGLAVGAFGTIVGSGGGGHLVEGLLGIALAALAVRLLVGAM